MNAPETRQRRETLQPRDLNFAVGLRAALILDALIVLGWLAVYLIRGAP